MYDFMGSEKSIQDLSRFNGRRLFWDNDVMKNGFQATNQNQWENVLDHIAEGYRMRAARRVELFGFMDLQEEYGIETIQHFLVPSRFLH